MAASKSWPDVAELVPHTGVARFLTEIHDVTATAIDVTGAVRREHGLVTDGVAPSFLAIELGAQAAAAMEALTRRVATGYPGAAMRGSLVRIRDARFRAATFPAEMPIRVRVELVGSAPPVAMYGLRAMIGDTLVVEARFSTHSGDGGASA